MPSTPGSRGEVGSGPWPVRMLGVPLSPDVDAATDPRALVALDVVQKFREGGGAAGSTHEPEVEPERHHRRLVGALPVENVEGVADVGEPLVARAETAGQPEFHV